MVPSPPSMMNPESDNRNKISAMNNNNTVASSTSSSYYDKGSNEVAVETSLIRSKLDKRRNLTRNSKQLVIVLVGLPGRGKSFIARKLLSFLTWRGNACKVFNVGKYRRQVDDAPPSDANFFDSTNKQAKEMREKIAAVAMKDMLKWLAAADESDGGDENSDTNSPKGVLRKANSSVESSISLSSSNTYTTSTPYCANNSRKDRIAIFDATNSTNARRTWILEQCKKQNDENQQQQQQRATRGKSSSTSSNNIGVVFLESLCDDQELLDENFYFKIANSPDYKDCMDKEEAIIDLRQRVEKYEQQYETITDDQLSYIKIYNLSSKLLINHVYGRMSKVIVPALQAWNIGSRPIYLCRPGMTPDGVLTDCDDYWEFNNSNHNNNNANDNNNGKNPTHHGGKKGSQLSSKGFAFRDALCDFMIREENTRDCSSSSSSNNTSKRRLTNTGTEIGTLSFDEDDLDIDDDSNNNSPPFPLVLMTSTMPRAVQTATWDNLSYPIDQYSNLNPLDKGDYTGMELDEIQQQYPGWYNKVETDPFTTRFPGGESYEDLIRRVEPCIIDMEQQVAPVVVVSHISVLQVLMSYFRFSPIEKCTSIEVPMNTVIKFTPERGGGWSESHHHLLSRSNSSSKKEDEVEEEKKANDIAGPSPDSYSCHSISEHHNTNTPIWGDHVCPFVYH